MDTLEDIARDLEKLVGKVLYATSERECILLADGLNGIKNRILTLRYEGTCKADQRDADLKRAAELTNMDCDEMHELTEPISMEEAQELKDYLSAHLPDISDSVVFTDGSDIRISLRWLERAGPGAP